MKKGGRFVPLRLLGQGGFGSVFEVEDKTDNKIKAMKVVS